MLSRFCQLPTVNCSEDWRGGQDERAADGRSALRFVRKGTPSELWRLAAALIASGLFARFAADNFAAPVKLEGATFIEHSLQLTAPALHTGFCAGEGNLQAVSEFLLREPIELGQHQCLAIRFGPQCGRTGGWCCGGRGRGTLAPRWPRRKTAARPAATRPRRQKQKASKTGGLSGSDGRVQPRMERMRGAIHPTKKAARPPRRDPFQSFGGWAGQFGWWPCG